PKRARRPRTDIGTRQRIPPERRRRPLPASKDPPEPLRLDPSCPRLRTLTQAALTADARAASRGRLHRPFPPSTLVRPRYTG
ncbi:hypothetical protein ABZV29_39955, partial [Streptomyces sp. NPDC005236]